MIPVSKRNENEKVISLIPNLPGGKTAQAKYLKSSDKLMKQFGNSKFVKEVDIAWKNVNKNKSLSNVTIYKTELAKTKAKLASLSTKTNKKLKETEQRFLIESDMNPLENHENEYSKIIETLQYVNIIWKELEL